MAMAFEQGAGFSKGEVCPVSALLPTTILTFSHHAQNHSWPSGRCVARLNGRQLPTRPIPPKPATEYRRRTNRHIGRTCPGNTICNSDLESSELQRLARLPCYLPGQRRRRAVLAQHHRYCDQRNRK